MRDFYYFGCGDGSGHYLFDRNKQRVAASHGLYFSLTKFDGSLPPVNKGLYVASVSRLGGIAMSAVAWWDQSVDTRPGSNSIVFCPSMTAPGENILQVAQRVMPWVFHRLPQPLTLMGDA